MTPISRGDVLAVLRRIATESPARVDWRYETYEAFTGRLQHMAQDMLDRINAEAKDAAKA